MELNFDLEGLDEFLACLQWLRDEEVDHFHCRTRAWVGGSLELSEERWTDWGGVVHHLRVDRIDVEQVLHGR